MLNCGLTIKFAFLIILKSSIFIFSKFFKRELSLAVRNLSFQCVLKPSNVSLKVNKVSKSYHVFKIEKCINTLSLYLIFLIQFHAPGKVI
jgi:hypothetical protein